ncbi:hypothetical protein C8R44DRAFT_889092 [Mycena epipterygia]|nr:hypothetical protein C8R44DRAFT_889092 [Mycena epipterygia]
MTPHKGIALVTGAAQGIGRFIALRLADDRFDVAVNDISVNSEKLKSLVDEIQAKGRTSSMHIADISQEDQVKAMVEQAVQRHGGLDVMVANAGVIGRPGLITEIPLEEWDRVLGTNARGTFLCYKYAGLQMINQGRGGRIIGASSLSGKQGSATQGPYCASKFAVRGLTQAAALEFGAHGITVNAYAPGAVDTPLVTAIGHAMGADLLSQFKAMSPLKKTGVPEDVASLVSFLASSGSQFITGQTISINGGLFFD